MLAVAAHAQIHDEYQVKAAFLLNFARFVDWSPDAFHNTADPMTLCVFGDDPFGPWLKETVDGKVIDGHPLVLRHISKSADADGCRILFVPWSGSGRVWPELGEGRKPNVLTVGERKRDGDCEAIITFTLDGDHVRFEINTQAAELAKLKISSRLLSLAHVVRK